MMVEKAGRPHLVAKGHGLKGQMHMRDPRSASVDGLPGKLFPLLDHIFTEFYIDFV